MGKPEKKDISYNKIRTRRKLFVSRGHNRGKGKTEDEAKQ